MNYLIGIPNELESTALRLYKEYGSNQGKLHYIKCYGRVCLECRTDPELYRVCPGCGAKLSTDTEIRPYECTCGTIIYICCRRQGPVVTRYITPHPLFVIKEDTI